MKVEYGIENIIKNNVYEKNNKLEPLLKWPGGKESELKHILPALPDAFENYYEPFVGGGSVYKSINAHHCLINDKSHELISFYRMLSDRNSGFINAIEEISRNWVNITEFAINNEAFLTNLYKQYKRSEKSQDQIKSLVNTFIEANHFTFEILFSLQNISGKYEINQLKNIVADKIFRIKTIEDKNEELSDSDIFNNLETSFKAAYYNYIRHLYNQGTSSGIDEVLKISFFYFLRNFAYSGMFRYSSKGNFNVPYGGIAYNRNTLGKKIKYFQSEGLKDHLSRTTFECLDFEAFFEKHTPTLQDFIFLDPPYDSEFSTYANNTFGREDQKRLANFLIHNCEAKWMMIINNTEFIYSLYNNEKLTIQPFAKKYLVSFMNRNEKSTEHLLIKNY